MCRAKPGLAWVLMIASPLIVTPAANASSRASVTARPELLVPSPEMSMTRRSAFIGAALRRSSEKSIAALIEVRLRNERGADRIVAAATAAPSPSWITVQSTTVFWSVAPDHSINVRAMAWCGPPVIALITRGSVSAAA